MKPVHRALVVPIFAILSLPAVYLSGRDGASVEASEQPEECLSCHPDFAVTLAGEHNHAPFSEGDCYACHEFHGFRNQVELRGSIIDICTRCHSEVEDLPEEQIHPPIQDDESCLLCHNPHSSEHKSLLITERESLCTECHDEPTAEEGGAHPPYARGECVECHSPHGSPFGGLMQLPAGYVCLGCHSQKLNGISPDQMHSADDIRSCDQCHNGHESDHQSLLHRDPQALCLSCHDDIASLLEEKEPHSVFEDEDCLLCHDPHSQKGSLNTVSAQPGLCVDCHSEIEEALGLEVEHPPAVEEDCTICHNPHAGVLQSSQAELCGECHETEESDFISSHADMEPERCASCHNPHGSSAQLLLSGLLHSPFEDGDCESCHTEGRNRYELQNRAVCLECHDEPQGDAHSNGSDKKSDCIECHDPHLSVREALLRPDK